MKKEIYNCPNCGKFISDELCYTAREDPEDIYCIGDVAAFCNESCVDNYYMRKRSYKIFKKGE